MLPIDDVLRAFALRLVEVEELDRAPADSPLRQKFGPRFAEMLGLARTLHFLVAADDLTIEACRQALDVFEELRLRHEMPSALDAVVVIFVHARPCPPERRQALLTLRPTHDVALYSVEPRVLDMPARQVASSAGWLSEAKPSAKAMTALLQDLDGGPVASSEEIDRKVQSRLIREQEFVEVLQSGQPWVVYALLGLIGLCYLAEESAGGSTRTDVAIRFGAKVNALVRAGEWWRLFTAAFLHFGPMHLLVNGYGIYAGGPFLESYFGPLRFAALYFFSALFGTWASFLMTDGVAAGASTAVSGLIGATLTLALLHRTTIPERLRKRLLSGFGTVIVINVWLSMSVKGIDHWAHAGGLVGGALAAALLPPSEALSKQPPSRFWRVACTVLVLAPALAGALALAAQFRLARDPLDYPVRPFVDPSGVYEVDVPALLEPGRLGREDALVGGPGLAVTFRSSGQGLDVLEDVDAVADRELAELQRRSVWRVERRGRLTIGAHEWVPIDLDPADRELRGRMLIGLIDRRVVVILCWAPAEARNVWLPLADRMAATLRPAGR